jgi:(4S)-4-hydroxy-5-phosphonooxypentane-2,3-dione isomerase
MIVTCVHIHVRAETVDKFIIATIANHRQSVREPGNLRFDFLQQSDDPCRFLLYEAYESEAAAAAHKNTSHYSLWRDTVKDFMEEPRNGIKYNILEPYDTTKW